MAKHTDTTKHTDARRKHAGTWALRFSAEDILSNGKALMAPFDQLSHQDFTDHVREKYGIDYRRALDWMNAARRFAHKPELLSDLSETVIRHLAAPSLPLEDVEHIIAEIRTGKIRSEYRAVEQVIRKCKEERPILEEAAPQPPNIAVPLQQNLLITPSTLSFLEAAEREKTALEACKTEKVNTLKDLNTRENGLRQELRAIEEKLRSIEEKKGLLETEISGIEGPIHDLANFLSQRKLIAKNEKR